MKIRSKLIQEFLKLKIHLKNAKEGLEIQEAERKALTSEKKVLEESIRNITYERDRAIEKKFMSTNQLNDPAKLQELKTYNDFTEQKLLEEQRKSNSCKELLADTQEKYQGQDTTLSVLNKKLDAVQRELEKIKKTRPPAGAAATKQNVSKIYSMPPPIISSQKTLPKPETSRLGFLSFFKRN